MSVVLAQFTSAIPAFKAQLPDRVSEVDAIEAKVTTGQMTAPDGFKALANLVAHQSAGTQQWVIGYAYSRYFPNWFWNKYPWFVSGGVPTIVSASPQWATPSTASMSLVYDSWPSALVDILDSDYVYRQDVRDMVSNAFRDGHMLQTAIELGIPTSGRSKRAIIKDIASVFSSGRRSPRRRSASRRRSAPRRRSYRRSAY